MDGITGLAAVIMFLGMPTAVLGMYTFYRVRKLRTEERLAAMQRGLTVPMQPDLTEAAHSRRAGILLIAGAHECANGLATGDDRWEKRGR